MCGTAMDLFSRSYFKEYFFVPLVGLSGKTVWKNNKMQEKTDNAIFSQMQD
jgi:hypothetical protein